MAYTGGVCFDAWMKVGVQLPEVERIVRWPELSRMVVAAEDAGFDSLWVGDHYLYRPVGTDGQPGAARGPWEAWTQLAAIAAITTRVTIAPFVASLTFHNPAVIAKMAATVDEVSAGRLVLGVGAGWNAVEYEAFGFPFERRIDRFEESFHVVRRLLAGETVSLDGDFVQLHDCVLHPPSVRSAPLPIMIGSSGRRMLDITLPYISAWNAWFIDYENRPEQVGRALAPLLAACERHDRDPSSIEKSVALLVDFGSTEPRQGSINPVSGDPGALTEALNTLEAAGLDHVQLVVNPIDERTILAAAEAIWR